MRNITSVETLEKAIRILEFEQSIKGELVKEQLMETYESLRIINLLKSSLKQTISSTSDVNDIAGMALGLISGYISKKVFVGTSENPFRRLFGSVLQVGVMGFISKHPERLKSLISFLINQMLHKRE